MRTSVMLGALLLLGAQGAAAQAWRECASDPSASFAVIRAEFEECVSDAYINGSDLSSECACFLANPVPLEDPDPPAVPVDPDAEAITPEHACLAPLNGGSEFFPSLDLYLGQARSMCAAGETSRDVDGGLLLHVDASTCDCLGTPFAGEGGAVDPCDELPEPVQTYTSTAESFCRRGIAYGTIDAGVAVRVDEQTCDCLGIPGFQPVAETVSESCLRAGGNNDQASPAAVARARELCAEEIYTGTFTAVDGTTFSMHFEVCACFGTSEEDGLGPDDPNGGPLASGSIVDLGALTGELFGRDGRFDTVEECIEGLAAEAETVDGEAIDPSQDSLDAFNRICRTAATEAGLADAEDDVRVFGEEDIDLRGGTIRGEGAAAETGSFTDASVETITTGAFYNVTGGETIGDIAVALRQVLCEGDPGCVPIWGEDGLAMFLANAVGWDAQGDSVSFERFNAGELIWIPPAGCLREYVEGGGAGGETRECDCFYNPAAREDCQSCEDITELRERAGVDADGEPTRDLADIEDAEERNAAALDAALATQELEEIQELCEGGE